jgi:hypothetical protein
MMAEVKDEGAGKMVGEVTKINRLPKEKGSHPAAHKLKDVVRWGERRSRSEAGAGSGGTVDLKMRK